MGEGIQESFLSEPWHVHDSPIELGVDLTLAISKAYIALTRAAASTMNFCLLSCGPI
jgi:hypothetical protein